MCLWRLATLLLIASVSPAHPVFHRVAPVIIGPGLPAAVTSQRATKAPAASWGASARARRAGGQSRIVWTTCPPWLNAELCFDMFGNFQSPIHASRRAVNIERTSLSAPLLC